jgi:GAF domain-containing protein
MSTEIRGTLHFLQQENVRLKSENDHLQHEVVRLRRVLRTLGTLNELAASINERTDVMKLLDGILQSALSSIGADDGSLLLIDEETNELAFVVVRGVVREKLVGHRIPMGQGIAGWVAEHAEPVIVKNAQLDKRFSPAVDRAFHFKTRSMLCVPIIHDGRISGVMQVLNKSNRKEFNEADLMLLGLVAQLAGTAIARAESFSMAEA